MCLISNFFRIPHPKNLTPLFLRCTISSQSSPLKLHNPPPPLLNVSTSCFAIGWWENVRGDSPCISPDTWGNSLGRGPPSYLMGLILRHVPGFSLFHVINIKCRQNSLLHLRSPSSSIRFSTICEDTKTGNHLSWRQMHDIRYAFPRACYSIACCILLCVEFTMGKGKAGFRLNPMHLWLSPRTMRKLMFTYL